MRVEGKVALVSGGSRGIGAATAELLAAEGAAVVIGDVLRDEGLQAQSRINESGGRCTFLDLDVTDEASWERVVAAASSEYGKVDVLVNNAGISGRTRVEETDGELWDRVMDINSKGVFLGTKVAIPAMRSAGGGSIINISSIYGIVGSETSTAYHSSKGAVRLLTKATAVQYAGEGIRCNSVHPGFVDSPMTARFHAQPEVRADLVGRTPLGRLGVPQDIAWGILFLASDESSFMTGSELVIDGGWTAQ